MPHERRPVSPANRARLIAAKMLAAARGELGDPANRTAATPNALATALEELQQAGLLRIVPTPGDAVPYRFEQTNSDRNEEANRRFLAAFDSLKTSNALPDLEPHLKHFGARSALRATLAEMPLVIDPDNGQLIGATPESLTRSVARLRRQLGALTLDNSNVVYAQKELREQFDAIIRLDEQGREYALLASRDEYSRANDLVVESSRPSPALLERLGALHQAGFGIDAARSVGSYDLRFTDPVLRASTFQDQFASTIDRRQAEAIVHSAIAEQKERERTNRREAMVDVVLRHGASLAATNPNLDVPWVNDAAGISNAEFDARFKVADQREQQLLERHPEIAEWYTNIVKTDEQRGLLETYKQELNLPLPDARDARTVVRDGLATLSREDAIALRDGATQVLAQQRTGDTQNHDRRFIARALANGLHLAANITTPLSEEQAFRLVEHLAEKSPATYRDLTRAISEELRRERRALQWSFEDSKLGRGLKRSAARERERNQLFQNRGTADARTAAVNRVPLDARLRVINEMSREALSQGPEMERNLELRERLDEAQRDENRRQGAIPTTVFTSSRDILQPRFVREKELDPLFLSRQAARERTDGAMTRLERDSAYEEVRLLDDLLRDKYDAEITNEDIGAAATFEEQSTQTIYETGRLGFLTTGGQYVRYDQLAAIAFPRGASYLPDRSTIELLAQAETPLTFSQQDQIVTAVSPENLDDAQRRIYDRQDQSSELDAADARRAARTAVAYDLTTTLTTAQIRLEQLQRVDSSVLLPREAGATSAIRTTTGPILAMGSQWAAMFATDGTNRIVFHETRVLPGESRVGDLMTITYAPSTMIESNAVPAAPSLPNVELQRLRDRVEGTFATLNANRAADAQLHYAEHRAPQSEDLQLGTLIDRLGDVAAVQFEDQSIGFVHVSTLERDAQMDDEVALRDTPTGIVGAAWERNVALERRAGFRVESATLTGERDEQLAALEPANFGGLNAEEQSVLRDLARDAAEREGLALTAHKAPEREQLLLAKVLARTGNGIALQLPDNTATLVSTARMKQLPNVGSEMYVRDTPNGVLPFDGRRAPTPLERLPERAHDIAYERAGLLALAANLGKRIDQLQPLKQHSVENADLAVLLPTNGDTYFGHTNQNGVVEYLALPTFSTRYGEHPLQRMDYESALQLADGARVEEWQSLARAQAGLPADQRKELAAMLTAGGSFAPNTAPAKRSNVSRDDIGNLNQPQERAESANLVANDLRRAINVGGAAFEFRQGFVVGMTPYDGKERTVPIVTINKGNDFPLERESGITVLGNVLDRHDAGLFYGVSDGDRGVVVGFISDTELGGPPPECNFGDLITLRLHGDNATVLDLVSKQDRDDQKLDREQALPDNTIDRGATA